VGTHPPLTPEFLCTLQTCHSSNDVKLLMGIHPRLASRCPIIGLHPPQLPRTLHICSNNVKFLMGTHPRLVSRSPIIGFGPISYRVYCTYVEMKVPFWRCSWVHTPDSTPQFLCTLHTCSNDVKLLISIHPRLASRYHIIGLDAPQSPRTLRICSNNANFLMGTHPRLGSGSPIIGFRTPSVTAYVAHM